MVPQLHVFGSIVLDSIVSLVDNWCSNVVLPIRVSSFFHPANQELLLELEFHSMSTIPHVADSLILFRSRSNLLVEQPLYLASHSSRPVQFIAGSNCVFAHQSSGSL